MVKTALEHKLCREGVCSRHPSPRPAAHTHLYGRWWRGCQLTGAVYPDSIPARRDKLTIFSDRRVAKTTHMPPDVHLPTRTQARKINLFIYLSIHTYFTLFQTFILYMLFLRIKWRRVKWSSREHSEPSENGTTVKPFPTPETG